MTKIFLSGFLVLYVLLAFSQPAIIPQPLQLTVHNGQSVIKTPVVIVFNIQNEEEKGNAIYLQNELKKRKIFSEFGEVVSTKKLLSVIQLQNSSDKMYQRAYQLSIDKNAVVIKGSSTSIFSGIQTLLQLVTDAGISKANNSFALPNLTIIDSPRFEYRGMHLDVSRHFFSVEFLKKYLDYLATYKFNRFHWHLTDDQGWRIPIAKYPLLTTIGAERNGTIVGRYPGKGNDNKPVKANYSLSEIKDVIKYAAERHIEVIPEIEMPGHASAAIAAYPWLSCFPEKPTLIPANMISKKSVQQQNEGRIKLVQETWGIFDDVFCAGKPETLSFLKDVLGEVIELFPSKYIHIGGDETPKTHWKKCPHCQQKMKDNNLKDEHELQSWLVNNVGQYLTTQGKTLIGWDEILEGGLADNAVVMSWRGETGGIEAAKQKHQVIMTPGKPLYFDHTQSTNEDSVTIGGLNTVESVYNYNPIPASLPTYAEEYVIGAQGNVWTEYMNNPSKVEYMLFPRIAALSEVLWTKKENKNWQKFQQQLPTLLNNLSAQKINHSKAYYDVTATLSQAINYEGILVTLATKLPKADLRYQYNTSAFTKYSKPIAIGKSVDVSYSIFDKGKATKEQKMSFYFNKATARPIKLKNIASTAHPGNGAFTLVDGIQNTKRLGQSTEFLGFNGTDLDVTIDLGKEMDVSEIRLHTLKQQASWIYLPKEVEVYYMPVIDSTVIRKHPLIESVLVTVDKNSNNEVIIVAGNHKCRYVRIVARNNGMIPDGEPGGGNKSWLFIDEIEIN